MQKLNVFDHPCRTCGRKMEIIKELQNTYDSADVHMHIVGLCKCENGHEEVREFEFDGARAFLRGEIYTKKEWEGLKMIKLRDVLELMDDFLKITVTVSGQDVCCFPMFALEFFKESILNRQVYRIENNRVYLEDGVKKNG